VNFLWDSPQGVFQIPDSTCPSNFTAWSTSNYKELSPIGLTGDFSWEVPRNAGTYWVTSPQPGMCNKGGRTRGRAAGGGSDPRPPAGRAVGGEIRACAHAWRGLLRHRHASAGSGDWGPA
jgi:hypothetical protein